MEGGREGGNGTKNGHRKRTNSEKSAATYHLGRKEGWIPDSPMLRMTGMSLKRSGIVKASKALLILNRVCFITEKTDK